MTLAELEQQLRAHRAKMQGQSDAERMWISLIEYVLGIADVAERRRWAHQILERLEKQKT